MIIEVKNLIKKFGDITARVDALRGALIGHDSSILAFITTVLLILASYAFSHIKI